MKLIPVYRPESAHHFAFASTELGNPDGDTWVNTGALKFGQPVDLLGISQTEALWESGVQDHTDCIDQRNFLIDKIFYRNFGSDEIKVLPADKFPPLKLQYKDDMGRQLLGGFELPQAEYNGHAVPPVQFHASVDLQTGRLLVTHSVCKYMELVGFTVDAERYNPNRRPVVNPISSVGNDATLRSLKAVLVFAQTMGMAREITQEIDVDMESEEDLKRLASHPKMVWLINWAQGEINSVVDRVVRTAREAFPRSQG